MTALQNPLHCYYGADYLQGTLGGPAATSFMLGTRLTLPGSNLNRRLVVAYSGTDASDLQHRTGHNHRSSCVPARLGKRGLLIPYSSISAYQYA